MLFNELNDEQKKAAIEEHRDWNVGYPWWKPTYEYCKEVALKIGLHIDEIQFSGFWNQGDGARFRGWYVWQQTNEALPERIEEIQEVLTRQAMLCAIHTHGAKPQIIIAFDRNSHYCHERTMEIDGLCITAPIAHDVAMRILPEEVEEEIIKLLDDEAMEEAMRSFAKWIYRELEKEYEYLTSDEAVAEALIVNEVEFTF